MHGRNVSDRVHGEYGHREYAMDHAECDLRREAQTEDQQDDRIERDLGNRIYGTEYRISHIAGEATETKHETEQQTAGNADDARIAKRDAGARSVVPKILPLQQRDGAEKRVGRSGHDVRSDQQIENLPADEKA